MPGGQTATGPTFGGQAIDPKLAAIAPFLEPKELYSVMAPKPTPNSAFNPDGTPNQAYQDYEITKALSGASSINNFGSPQEAVNPVTGKTEFWQPGNKGTGQFTGVVPALKVDTPKPKPGERYNATLERMDAIPGSDIYIKQSSAHGKDFAALKSVDTKMNAAIAKINEITDKKNESGFNANFGGYNAYLSQYGMGEATNTRKKIESIKSDLKSAGLEMMRAGGSIGVMSEREWPIVEAMIARIDPALTETAARDEFNKIIVYMENIKKNGAEAYSTEWSNTQYFKGGNKPPAKPDGKTSNLTKAEQAELDALRKKFK